MAEVLVFVLPGTSVVFTEPVTDEEHCEFGAYLESLNMFEIPFDLVRHAPLTPGELEALYEGTGRTIVRREYAATLVNA